MKIFKIGWISGFVSEIYGLIVRALEGLVKAGNKLKVRTVRGSRRPLRGLERAKIGKNGKK